MKFCGSRKNTFFNTYWDYKHSINIHGGFPAVYTSERILNLSSRNKIPSKCDVIKGSVVNGTEEPILFSFVLNKPADIKFFASLKQFILKK